MKYDAYIRSMNLMLASLGSVCGGTNQRFQWMWSEDITYWSGRMRPRWVLAAWQRPKISEKEWVKDFPEIAYPANGMYHAKPETALKPGERPSVALTDSLVMGLDKQMSKSALTHDIEALDSIKKLHNDDYVEWVEFVQDTAPAFNNFDWGSRGGSVSFGGI